MTKSGAVEQDCEGTISPAYDEAGILRGFLKVVHDISKWKHAEDALRESEEQFRLLLNGVTDYAIYMLDLQGNVSSWNAGATRIKGYQEQEILGKHFSIFYTPEDVKRGKPKRGLQEVASKVRYEEQGRRVRKDGSEFWANVVITRVYDDASILRGFCKVARDIQRTNKVQMLWPGNRLKLHYERFNWKQSFQDWKLLLIPFRMT